MPCIKKIQCRWLNDKLYWINYNINMFISLMRHHLKLFMICSARWHSVIKMPWIQSVRVSAETWLIGVLILWNTEILIVRCIICVHILHCIWPILQIMINPTCRRLMYRESTVKPWYNSHASRWWNINTKIVDLGHFKS